MASSTEPRTGVFGEELLIAAVPLRMPDWDVVEQGCILFGKFMNLIAGGGYLGDCLGFDEWFWFGECVGESIDC
jgi:hypothetical protein